MRKLTRYWIIIVGLIVTLITSCNSVNTTPLPLIQQETQLVVERISNIATTPFFNTQGDLIYLEKQSESWNVKKNGITVATFTGEILGAAFSADGRYLLLETQIESGEQFLQLLDCQENSIKIVASGYFWFSWQDQRKFIYWGQPVENNSEFSLDIFYAAKLSDDNKISVDEVHLENLFLAGLPEEIMVSSDGKLLLIQSSGHVDVWKRDSSDSYTHLPKNYIDTVNVLLDPQSERRLILLNDMGTLMSILIEEPEVPPKILTDRVTQPLAWEPSGENLFYASDNIEQGGSTIWKINLDSGSRIMLADASQISGKVIDLVISPTNNQIAYLTISHRLETLTFLSQ
ncbi:MAG: hypothetical protein JEZ06_03625 [Anaerolineaceae bacterium]|nr:hypothetical protein [Anaerolineaceae bacterium]